MRITAKIGLNAAALALALAAVPVPPAGAQSSQGLYWLCRPASPGVDAGYCPVSSSTPLPVQGTSGGVATIVTGSGSAGTPAAGVVTVQGISGGVSQPVVGGVAAGAAVAGVAPVVIGGSDGTNVQTFGTDTNGSAKGILFPNGAVNQSYNGALADGATNTVNEYGFVTNNTLFNGTTWDRAFTCTQTAAVAVAAGNTTQVIALSGTQRVRICGFTLAMSLTGTAAIQYGTGTNCGTGNVSYGDVPLATGTPWTMTAPSGGAVLRNQPGTAICVKAVTGNVLGFINYAQF